MLSPISIATSGNLQRSPLALYADGYLANTGAPPQDVISAGGGFYTRRKPQSFGDVNGMAPDDARVRRLAKQNQAVIILLQ